MSMKVISTGKTAVKPTKRGGRVWVEGGKVARAGFNWGTRYTRTIENGIITMKVDPNGPLKTAGRNKGGKELPIIDISMESFDGLPVNTKLVVEYYNGLIIIKAAI